MEGDPFARCGRGLRRGGLPQRFRHGRGRQIGVLVPRGPAPARVERVHRHRAGHHRGGAAPLGLEFLSAFSLRGELLGTVMRQLRAPVPLGLLYGSYCPSGESMCGTNRGRAYRRGPPIALWPSGRHGDQTAPRPRRARGRIVPATAGPATPSFRSYGVSEDHAVRRPGPRHLAVRATPRRTRHSVGDPTRGERAGKTSFLLAADPASRARVRRLPVRPGPLEGRRRGSHGPRDERPGRPNRPRPPTAYCARALVFRTPLSEEHSSPTYRGCCGPPWPGARTDRDALRDALRSDPSCAGPFSGGVGPRRGRRFW